MCGIAGILNRSGLEPTAGQLLSRMLAIQRHRGPDQFGMYLDQNVALGSARLSIIDTAGGQQPVSNEDGRLWIVYNGEVYNYRELRIDLEKRGHCFATHSDTEVIVHLYETFGEACLSYLNGQFAFAIWDTLQHSLFIARDRLGVRPVFYHASPHQFTFASEIKAIFASQCVQAEIDPLALDQVFTYWSVQSPRTIFRNIQELPPGHFLKIQAGELTIQPYWQLDFDPQAAGQKRSPAEDRRFFQQTVEGFNDLLVDSTRLRLRSDVPVGVYVSGGLDSSTTAAIARSQTTGYLAAFSIQFTDTEYDERQYQQMAADHLGIDLNTVEVSAQEIGEVFPDVIWHTETPLLRTAPAPLYLLSRLVHSYDYKVVLTGEAADELLGGYDIFKETLIRRFWARQPQSSIRPLLFKRIYPFMPMLTANSSSFLSSFFGQGLTDTGAFDYSHSIRWKTTSRARRFFAVSLTEAITQEAPADVPHGFPHGLPAGFGSWDALQQAQYLEIITFLSPYLLSSQGDRVAMANSVEGRFPFLDHRLVEFCTRLPLQYKLHGLNEKYLLKKAAERWLPAEISQRVKKPYRAPIQRCFFEGKGQEYARELTSPECLAETGLFKPQAVQLLVDKASSPTRLSETDEMALVGVLSSQILFKRFVASFAASFAACPPLQDTDHIKVCLGPGAPPLIPPVRTIQE